MKALIYNDFKFQIFWCPDSFALAIQNCKRIYSHAVQLLIYISITLLAGVPVDDAINITDYRLQNTALLCTINYINTKRKDNQPATLRTPVSIIAGFARVIKLPKPSVPEPKNFAQFGKCFRLRGRIDIARANQKPLFT